MTKGSYEQSINGQAYRVTYLPNGEGSYSIHAFRYACGSWHSLPAFERVEANEHDARNAAAIIFAMIRIEHATNRAVDYAAQVTV